MSGLSIRFLGGAGTVTGSKFLIERGRTRILVDCGLFQGLKTLRLLNWTEFPVKPSSVDAVVLTHAHLDHSGAIPLLVREGFRGKIHCTAPTQALSRILLLDSARIQEEDAEQADREGWSKHHPPKPLYTTRDAENALSHFRTHPPDEWISLTDDFEMRFLNAGHILGSAIVQVRTPEGIITFTGDLGRRDPLVLLPAEQVSETDYLVIESTYGDRLHPPLSPLRAMADIVNETIDRGGQVIIPAFSVGRVQDLLFILMQLRLQAQIRADFPIYLDSPMGIEATEVYSRFSAWHRLKEEEISRMCEMTKFIRTQRESWALIHSDEPAIILAGSGMITGGRVLSHLVKRLPDPRNTVVMAGFQAAGTRGSLLETGSPSVKIHGRFIPSRARIRSLSMLSAHGDQSDLLAWAGSLQQPPKKTFVVHGEPQAAEALKLLLRDQLAHDAYVPEMGESVILS